MVGEKVKEGSSLLVSWGSEVKEKGCWGGSCQVSNGSQEESQCRHSRRVTDSRNGRERGSGQPEVLENQEGTGCDHGRRNSHVRIQDG